MDRFDFIKIANNASYDISLNKSKNYAIVALIGIWDKNAQIEYYLDDIKLALKDLSDHFSLIIDLKQYRGSTSEFTQLHVDALQSAINSGVGKTALVLPDNPMLKVTVEYIIKLSGMQVSYFNNMITAERWLDAIQHQQ